VACQAFLAFQVRQVSRFVRSIQVDLAALVGPGCSNSAAQAWERERALELDRN